MTNQSRKKIPLPLQVTAFAVIIAVSLILIFPVLFPLTGSSGSSGVAPDRANANLNGAADSSQNQTPQTSTALGPHEKDLLSWVAPLLNPGDDTTPVENITPNIRKLRLDALVKYQVGRFQLGVEALKQVSTAADAVEERMTLLARMNGFVKDVNSGPARSLWETLSSRPATDRRTWDANKQTFQNAIDRLQLAQAEGFQKRDDPRLDARSDLAALEDAMKWLKGEATKLRGSQRDLDRVEFVVWTRARELPPTVDLPSTQSATRQTVMNFDWAQHLAMVQTVREKLEAKRTEIMGFLRTLPKVNDQVQSFLAEPLYADDPVGNTWVNVRLTSSAFLAEFHLHEGSVDVAEENILSDPYYQPSLVTAWAVAANEWLKKSSTQPQDGLFRVGYIQRSIGSAPVFLPGNDMAEMVKRPDGRISTSDETMVKQVAAWRKLVARHTYAITLDRPGNQYNWAAEDILEPYLSYDYWWRWATNAEWYRGSDVRLDPDRFPKDAAATQKLWREFRLLIDAEERLTPQCIKISLADRNAHLADKNEKDLPAERVRTYWETFFLPATIAKEVGYRRPPIPDATTARLRDEIPGVGEFPAKLKLLWSGVIVMPRQWRLNQKE